MNRGKTKSNPSVEERALQLLDDPRFLYKAGQMIGKLGVVGEEPNRLVLFLAGITRTTSTPASVLVKGATSSGKSTLVKASVRLFPSESVIERSSLSGKALAHGSGSLAEKILFLHEYHGGRDAQLLLRVLQSDGQIKHEFATVQGSRRGTQVAERVGLPVVLTTTTDPTVYADDETRFLSVWADESPEQNLAIVVARARGPNTIDERDLPVWQRATSLLKCRSGDFTNPPPWIRYVAENLPLARVRVRRDWDRFLSFCCAIALCRAGRRRGRQLDLTFPDFCVAYRILEPVFASTNRGVRTQEVELSNAVARLNMKLRRAATVQEVADVLGWKESLVYKRVKGGVQRRVLEYEPGTRERNVKGLLARLDTTGFLPKPAVVLRENPGIGKNVEYVDPFTGETMVITPTKRAAVA
jgi:energy-coupling factor transporter ATP-binding protein EcfA2